MPEQQVKTTRSFCRVCTSVCGILVETVGEQVVRVRGVLAGRDGGGVA